MSRREFRRALLLQVGDLLPRTGFTKLLGSPAPFAALYYKIWKGLAMVLCVEISWHYDDRFTASFGLSRTFTWSFPPKCSPPTGVYERLGHFLTTAERRRILSAGFWGDGIKDAWWIGCKSETLQAFLEAVRLCEPRFLNQPALRDGILACEAISHHAAMVDAIVQRVERNEVNLTITRNTIPSAWQHAAEEVVREKRPEYLKQQYVAGLALDAWRVAKYFGETGTSEIPPTKVDVIRPEE